MALRFETSHFPIHAVWYPTDCISSANVISEAGMLHPLLRIGWRPVSSADLEGPHTVCE